ncbi:MAG TPA: biotin/lipoyl-containing protein [Thermoanaerobaculia bacterium]
MRLSSGEATAEVALSNGRATVNGREMAYRELRSGSELRALEIDGNVVIVRTLRRGDVAYVWCAGAVFEVRRETGRKAHAAEAGGLVAPMPGRLSRALVEAGESVTRGQPIVALEAMKMEHVIRSPREGKVARLFFREGDLVEAGAVLAEIDG